MFSFIVPAFNEEDNIAATIETIKSAAASVNITEFDVVVVNDGSTDRTGDILKELVGQYPFLQVKSHDKNLGLGNGIRSGVAAAKYNRFMIIPGDNDMDINFIKLMLKFKNSADLVMSFPINTENRPLLRNILSYFFRIFYMVGFNIHVNYINGPCIYNTVNVRELNLHSNGFSIIAELGVKLLKKGNTFCEIPGYFQTGTRPRKMLSLKNFIEVIKTYLRLLYEIHYFNKAEYGKTPQRIFVDFTA